VIRSAIRGRYQLLPYIYTLFWENHNTGRPIVRPLFVEYPKVRLSANSRSR
jgi:alpha-glucosidase (family GH31 glycosyl hydrolase)